MFEINSDAIYHTRKVKTLIDWLGQIAGLFNVFLLVFGVIIAGYSTFRQNAEMVFTLEEDEFLESEIDFREGDLEKIVVEK